MNARTPEKNEETVLVIDDDSGMRSLLSDLLESQGYRVLQFPDPIGALELLLTGTHEIDAAVCDLNMPKINGLEFLTALSKMNARVPVILITAFGTAKTEQDAKKGGAFGYLSKPFSLKEMSELVKKATSSPPTGNAA